MCASVNVSFYFCFFRVANLCTCSFSNLPLLPEQRKQHQQDNSSNYVHLHLHLAQQQPWPQLILTVDIEVPVPFSMPTFPLLHPSHPTGGHLDRHLPQRPKWWTSGHLILPHITTVHLSQVTLLLFSCVLLLFVLFSSSSSLPPLAFTCICLPNLTLLKSTYFARN